MNFDFYIFGVPHGFDIFRNDTAGYFQSLFYDGSRENTKLTIHRKANGEVSYSYLRYNFMANGDREGSFFGMSAVFANQYCTNPVKLYRLFDTVYTEIILKGKVLLEEVTEIPTVQAKFLIRTFKDAISEVNLIESVIREKIDTAFANDFKSFDNTFKQSDENILVEINLDAGNDGINNELRKNHFVSISPEFKKQIKLRNATIADLEKKQIVITNRIADDALLDLSDEKNIDIVRSNVVKFGKYITGIQNYIQPHLEYQQGQLSQLKQYLDKNTDRLDTLQNKIAKNTNSKKNENSNTVTDEFSFTLNGIRYTDIDELLSALEKEIKTDNKIRAIEACDFIINWQESTSVQKQKAEDLKKQVDTKPSPILFFLNKHKLSITIAAAVVVALVIVIAFAFNRTPLTEEEIRERERVAQQVHKGDSLLLLSVEQLSSDVFLRARGYFEEAGRQDRINDANSRGVAHYTARATTAASAGSIQGYEQAISYLEKTREFGNDPTVAIAGHQAEIAQLRGTTGTIVTDRGTPPPPPPQYNQPNITIEIVGDFGGFYLYDVITLKAVHPDGTLHNRGRWFLNGFEAVDGYSQYNNPISVRFIRVGQGSSSVAGYGYPNSSQAERRQAGNIRYIQRINNRRPASINVPR